VDDFEFGCAVSQKPEGSDADLLGLANLLFPYRYPTAMVSIKPNKTDLRLKMASVGGSFLDLPHRFLQQNHFIDVIDYFFYFDSVAFHEVKGEISARNPADYHDKRALYAPLLLADIVLLEGNVASVSLGNLNKLYDYIFNDRRAAGHAQ
jgi:hypothetical protein